MTSSRHAHAPPAGVFGWSTDAVPRRQRLEYWIDAISDALFSMSTTARSTGQFRSSLEAASLDALQLVFAEGSGQASFRTRSLVARGGPRSYHLVGDFHSPWVLARRGVHQRVRVGELVLLDSTEVHGGIFPESCTVTNLKMPPAWIRTWLTDPDRLLGCRIDRQAGWGGALSSFVAQLTPGIVATTTVPHRVVTDQIGAMLSMVECERMGSPAGDRASAVRTASRSRRIAEHVRERASDPWLDAASIAASMNLAPATIHHWLADAGDTFGALLERQRMALASDLLAAGASDAMRIADIAVRVGIPDVKRLARLMRRHFGESPAAHRRASRTA